MGSCLFFFIEGDKQSPLTRPVDMEMGTDHEITFIGPSYLGQKLSMVKGDPNEKRPVVLGYNLLFFNGLTRVYLRPSCQPRHWSECPEKGEQTGRARKRQPDKPL